DVVTAWHVALVVRWQHEVPTTLAGVWPRQAHVGDPTLVVVIHQPDKWARRQFNDHRSFGKVEDTRAVGCIGVERETELSRTGARNSPSRSVLDARFAIAVENTFNRNRGVPEPIGGHSTLEIRIVAVALRGFRRGVSTFEPVLRWGLPIR